MYIFNNVFSSRNNSWNHTVCSLLIQFSGWLKQTAFTNVCCQHWLSEVKHVIYIIVNHMEIRHCLIHDECYLVSQRTWGECRLVPQCGPRRISVHAAKRTRLNASQITREWCLSDQISNWVLTRVLRAVGFWSDHSECMLMAGLKVLGVKIL